MIKNNKDKQNKRVARGWEDEEDNQQQKITPTNKPQSYFKRDDDQSIKVDTKQGVSNSSIPTTKQTFSINLEKQLIDSILSSTGITAKPSDSQFKDYLSRVKSLNRDNINNLLHSKLVQFYEENDMKGLQKCLYVIEFSINNKIDEIKQYFQTHSDLMMEMKDNIQGNNKVSEIFNNILILLGKVQKQTVNSFDTKKKFIKQAENKPSNKEPEQTQSNMLDDILFSNNVNVGESEPVQVQVTSLLGEDENEKKKGFGFIKKDKTGSNNLKTNEIDFFNNSQTVLVNQTSNINITVVQNPEVAQKKGFGFVKKNNQKENDIVTGIDNINLTSESSSNNKKIDLSDILNQVYTEQKPLIEKNVSPLNQQYINLPQNNMNNQVPNYVQYQNPNIMNNMYNNGYNPQYQQQMYPPNNVYYQQQQIYNPQYTQQHQHQSQPHHIEKLKQENKEEQKKDDKLKFNFLDDLLKPKN